jgi:MEDS: MEthanogen/methylotroph, DcmR Sensory domain
VSGVDVGPGEHVCVLYRGRAELDRLLAPFLADGLRGGDACLLLEAEDEGRAFRDVLARLDPGTRPYTDDLRIRGPELYLRDGVFDADRTLTLLSAWADTVLAPDPPPLVRLATDMSWAAPLVAREFVDDLIGYETAAARRLAARPVAGMCLYDLELFGSEAVVPLVRVHPKVLLNGTVTENPYAPGGGSTG